MSIRCVIAEDEALALQKLKMFLSAEPGIHVVAECRDANETVAALNTYRPDLLFLDIQMPGDDGFEVLKQVTPDYLPLVIFTTAFDNYAVKAFEMHALDYLLKPFDRERLHTALERAQKQLLNTGSEAVTHRMLDFLATAPDDAEG
jgi:two-component system LytT family response regulator